MLLLLLLLQGAQVYKCGFNDQSPIVMADAKLLFFTIPKNGCTQWKQLFGRVLGLDWKLDWKDETTPIVHKPGVNGLKYLFEYPLQKDNEFLTSPEWTRAVCL